MYRKLTRLTPSTCIRRRKRRSWPIKSHGQKSTTLLLDQSRLWLIVQSDILPHCQNISGGSSQNGNCPLLMTLTTGDSRSFRRRLRDHGSNVWESQRWSFLDYGCCCSSCRWDRDESERWESSDGIYGPISGIEWASWEIRNVERVVSFVCYSTMKGAENRHPGYGCWLSGIDVNTQQNNQRFNDPYLAVVIDPNRTVSAGKVEIGAFRTYPEVSQPPPISVYELTNRDTNLLMGLRANISRFR